MQIHSHYLRSYARRNHKRVSGWLGRNTIAQTIQIDNIQHELDIFGHVGEIGIHHGKLFILLYLLARDDELAVAVDIFEQQELNVDKSGQGSLHVLKENLETYAGGTARLRVISANSMTIGPEEIRSAAGGDLRILSIDGGHLTHIVRHDLNTAAAAICDGGVIILDDYFNPEFPGVSEGVNQYFLMDNQRELVPFFVAMNKIYLTTKGYAARYMDHFTRTDLGVPYEATTKFRVYSNSSSPIRVTEMFGANVLSYSQDHFGMAYRIGRTITQQGVRLRIHLSNSVAWRYIRNTALGHFVRQIADKLTPY